MFLDNKIWIGDADGKRVCILPKMANRHGLISGATGTGKTITLKVLAESFSDAGVPVFLADVKGDLAGMCNPGVDSEDLQKRIKRFGLDSCGFTYHDYPTVFWDVFGQSGIPLRTTISEMGPVLLSRLMDLNQTQSDILTIIFQIADDNQLLLIDTKDLKAMLQYVSENSKVISEEYGNMSKQSLAAILRHVAALEAAGGDQFFGEPALNLADWFTNDISGRGTINVLDCRSLIQDGTMYSVFLLWMLSELFEELPEVGDPEKPRMVFFFDEAHLLFNSVSKALQQKIEQIIKLIRSKGVGVYFITQTPRDIPDAVLSQLGNKIQHALRAYTPSDEKAVKAAVNSYRPNPAFDTREVLLALGTGEALISVLDEDGVPTVVENCKVLPPQSQMGPIPDDTRQAEIMGSNLYLRYSEMYDRDSAYEFISRKRIQAAEELEQKRIEEENAKKLAQMEAEIEKERQKQLRAQEKEMERLAKQRAREQEREMERLAKQAAREEEKRKKATANLFQKVANSAGGTIGRELGNQLGKQLGGSFGKKLGGNVGASLGRGILGNLFRY